MKITFHPKRVRTPEQIQAAKRFRTAKSKCELSENLFLAKDGVEGEDHHQKADMVAGRFTYKKYHGEETSSYHPYEHRGFVQKDGRLDVLARHRGKTSIVRLQRNEDKTRLQLEHLKGGKPVEREVFQQAADGTVTYERTELKEAKVSSEPLAFQPGAVDSPNGVVAKEQFDYLSERLDKLNSTVSIFDQDENNDLNNSAGEVALRNTPIASLEPIRSRFNQEFLADKIARQATNRGYEPITPMAPNFTGYSAESGTLDATIHWTLEEAADGANEEAYFEAQRSQDKSSGELETLLRTPIRETFRYVRGGSSTTLKNIKEERQTLSYRTDEGGRIIMETSESEETLPPQVDEHRKT